MRIPANRVNPHSNEDADVIPLRAIGFLLWK